MNYKGLRIKSIEHCPIRINNPYMVEVEYQRNGKTETRTYDVVLRCDYKNGQFIIPSDFPKDESPIRMIMPNGEISDFVRAEFEKKFEKQIRKSKQ